jgi:polysaccharide pyruvyl transferase CsaB
VRYLISGYYGEGNLGDEAILAGILQGLERHDPRADSTVISFAPADTERRHGVAAVSTSLRRPGPLLRALDAADILISGGGSFLHEADFDLYGRSFLFREGKLRPVPYFLSVVLLAQARGVPVIWYAQGLGPLRTAPARRLVAFAARRSAALTWRDRDAAALAAEVGARAAVEAVVPDPAYCLRASPPADSRRAVAAAGVRGPYLAVSPRPWLRMTGYRSALVAAVNAAVREYDLDVVFVPLQERTDGPLCRELAAAPELAGRAAVLTGVEDPALLAGVLGQARACITMRLHAGILSAVGGAPAAVIDYDPKVRAFARQTGQEAWTVSVQDLETAEGARRLRAAALETTRRAGERCRLLAARVSRLRVEAGRPARLAVQIAEASARSRGRTP